MKNHNHHKLILIQNVNLIDNNLCEKVIVHLNSKMVRSKPYKNENSTKIKMTARFINEYSSFGNFNLLMSYSKGDYEKLRIKNLKNYIYYKLSECQIFTKMRRFI
jgi:hypothetical protein